MKRYDPDIIYHDGDYGYPSAEMREDQDGKYIEYDEIKKLKEKIKGEINRHREIIKQADNDSDIITMEVMRDRIAAFCIVLKIIDEQ